MALLRLTSRLARPASTAFRPLSTSVPLRLADTRQHDNTASWRETQQSKPTGPHMTNTNSTIANEMPSVGADKAPPELLTSVDPEFVPKDSDPENTERMTGGTQPGKPAEGANAELDVGEMEGANFKVEPLRRTGEDGNTMRARLLCPFHLALFPSLCTCTPATETRPTPLTITTDDYKIKKTRAANAEPSNLTSSSPPSRPPTSHT